MRVQSPDNNQGALSIRGFKKQLIRTTSAVLIAATVLTSCTPPVLTYSETPTEQRDPIPEGNSEVRQMVNEIFRANVPPVIASALDDGESNNVGVQPNVLFSNPNVFLHPMDGGTESIVSADVVINTGREGDEILDGQSIKYYRSLRDGAVGVRQESGFGSFALMINLTRIGESNRWGVVVYDDYRGGAIRIAESIQGAYVDEELHRQWGYQVIIDAPESIAGIDPNTTFPVVRLKADTWGETVEGDGKVSWLASDNDGKPFMASGD